MNVLLLVIDSLRTRSVPLTAAGGGTPSFFAELGESSIAFRRAYAAECWTLPSHVSMFTGLLPSEHGAHFQTMAYRGSSPTAAEVLAGLGYATEVVTRNFLFDGTVPGVVRGFQRSTRPLATAARLDPFAVMLALTKPRNRRVMRSTGFFHPLHRQSRSFLATYSRTLLPADTLALHHVLERMEHHRHAGRPYFIFSNLYDVHWPYPPNDRSVLEEWSSLRGSLRNLLFPFVLPRIGSHRYLRPRFRLSRAGRRMLLDRYRSAVESMDAKLRWFFAEATRAGLLQNTLVIVTSDHGEAFGEHDLYLHDASVWDVHLHVPLWVRMPGAAPEVVDDVVSTRGLFGLITSAALGRGGRGTILDPAHRARHPVAVAQHFHYPHVAGALPQYRLNQMALVSRSGKAIARGGPVEVYDYRADGLDEGRAGGDGREFEALCRRDGISAEGASRLRNELEGWRSTA